MSAEAGLDPLVKDLVDVAGTIATTVALIVGGLFAYFKFFRERVFYPRLEPTLTASWVHGESQDRDLLVVSATIKNAGLAKVDLKLEPSCLRIDRAIAPTTSRIDEVQWKELAILDISDRHQWIEAQEVIQQRWLIAVPSMSAYSALRAELRLVGSSSEWYAEVIVVPGMSESDR